MTIPLLQYAPSSQNTRVAGYTVGGDEQPFVFTTDNVISDSDFDVLINAAYRQIFFHAFKCDRQQLLESQLRNGQITVRDFIRGLLLSKPSSIASITKTVTIALLSSVSNGYSVAIPSANRKKLPGQS